MIKIILNNEALDIDPTTVVTFKKAQQLNGIQDLYSFSNNFNLKDSAKNRRLLGINYLPNSKAKSMTAGYEVDVILNGCIFLKKQKLKVQKEAKGAIPVYVIFSDNLLIAKAKNTLMNQLPLGFYSKSLPNFLAYNGEIDPFFRTGPISAQDKSGFVVVEEVPILLNIKELVLKIFTFLGYSYTGDILTDENIVKYYINSNVGTYGSDGTPKFSSTLTVYDFLLYFLETFNGYIEVLDSSRSLGLFFWRNIENIKSQFVDYSDKFTGFTEYIFEGGLAKVNTLKYTDSPDYYNGFFNNNKSIIDKTEYLNSNFGAGDLRLFSDQSLNENGTLPLRVTGEVTDPKTINVFRFEEALTQNAVYSEGVVSYHNLYKAFSPNILEIWQLFHKPYTDNIALPTIAQLDFRYDAIFLANFKMAEVFFIKQLSTYWLPMELNFTSKKEGVKVKCLMIEKTPVDSPIVFDQSLSVDFYGDVFILDIFALYSPVNVSPAATMTITAADLTKNNIYVNGVQILAFPTSIDVSNIFEFKVSNIEAENVLSNSDIMFQFVSEQGGVSRVGKINVAHNGRANFVSEFRSEPETLYSYGQNDTDGFSRSLNYAGRINTPINIADTFDPVIGDIAVTPGPPLVFKALQFDRDSVVSLQLTIGYLQVYCSNRGGGAEARTRIYFRLWKNGNILEQVYSAGAIDNKRSSNTVLNYFDINVLKTYSVSAGDEMYIEAYLDCSEENRVGSGTMDGSVTMKNVIWKFSVTEQL